MNTTEHDMGNTAEPSHAIVPIDLMNRALEAGAGIDVLEKLMGLQERWESNQARRAFDAAMAAAKAEIPVILKSRQVDFTTNKGRTRYRYEDLAEIARTVDPVLGAHGLSYRFRTACVSPDNLTVTCILSHRDGHSEENSLAAGHDGSGNKNSIQAIGSVMTYLQRYTLKAALGLAASDDDDAQAVVPSSEEYTERWRILIENAISADELATQWKAEHALRGQIAWPNGAMPSRLRDDVVRRIGQLNAKPADQVEAEPEAATS
jgi:hypothetical protein